MAGESVRERGQRVPAGAGYLQIRISSGHSDGGLERHAGSDQPGTGRRRDVEHVRSDLADVVAWRPGERVNRGAFPGDLAAGQRSLVRYTAGHRSGRAAGGAVRNGVAGVSWTGGVWFSE